MQSADHGNVVSTLTMSAGDDLTERAAMHNGIVHDRRIGYVGILVRLARRADSRGMFSNVTRAPSLLAEIAFTEMTSSGKLRPPSFQGLRDDKPATTVTRERPATDRARSSPR